MYARALVMRGVSGMIMPPRIRVGRSFIFKTLDDMLRNSTDQKAIFVRMFRVSIVGFMQR